MSDRAQKNDSQLIFGRNAVLEAIKAGVAIDKLYVAPVEQRGSMGQIISLANAAGVPGQDVTGQKLDAMTGNQTQQGVAATVAAVAYTTIY